MTKLIEVSEFSEVTSLELSELISGQKFLIDPNSFKYIGARRNQLNSVSIFSKGYIGHIPLNEDVSLFVRPKFAITNLVRVLQISGVEFVELINSLRAYSREESEADQIFWLIAKRFLTTLRPIYVNGMWQINTLKHYKSSAPRGHWNIGQTATRNWSSGKFHLVNFSEQKLTTELWPNQILLSQLFDLRKKIACSESRLVRTLDDECAEFASLFAQRLNVPAIEKPSYNNSEYYLSQIPDSKYYYRDAILAAEFLNSSTGVSLENHEGNIVASNVLINMAELFEKYLLRLLQTNLEAFDVHDGNYEGKKSLFTDRKNPMITPDIVVSHDGKYSLICDVKYKPKVHTDDRYQAISYGVSYGCSKVILILPATGEMSGLKECGLVGDSDTQIELFEYRFRLNNEDIFAEEQSFIQAMDALCKP